MAANDIESILGGMSKEEYADTAGLLPSNNSVFPSFSDYDPNEDRSHWPYEDQWVMAGRLNSLFGSPLDWPTGELSAFADHLADSDAAFEPVFPLAVVKRQDDDVWACELVSSRKYAEAQAGRSSRVKENLYAYGVSCPDMPHDAMKQLLGDASLTEVISNLDIECSEESVKGFVPLITSDSMRDLEAVIEHSNAAPKNKVLRGIYDSIQKAPTISVDLKLFIEGYDHGSDFDDDGYYCHSVWKDSAGIYMDPDRANVLLTALRNLEAHGIEITEEHPLPPANILKLSEMVDGGLCDYRSALVPSVMFQPPESNRVFITLDEDHDVDEYGDSYNQTYTSIEYLPDTDRFLKSITRYSDYWKSPEDMRSWTDDYIVTKKEAYQFLFDPWNDREIKQTPEVNEIIDRLKHEVAPDPADGRGCDLDCEHDDARDASGAMGGARDEVQPDRNVER